MRGDRWLRCRGMQKAPARRRIRIESSPLARRGMTGYALARRRLDGGRHAMEFDGDALKRLTRPKGLPFRIGKLGHVVLNVTDLSRSVRFYTEILGFAVSDVYPPEIVPGGMVFMRCNADHHGVALVGELAQPSQSAELNHLAFEVGALEEVLRARDHLTRLGVAIDFHGRRRAGCQIAVEFRDPDGHRLEIYWGIDQVGSDGQVRPPAEWKGAHSLEAAIADPVRGQDTTVQDRALLKK
jgi:catechol 2,3-dioxygenase-like lactoylglutathione lyase family enzyme